MTFSAPASSTIEAGVGPHVVMGWSGHRTESMLRRYNIIDLDDLRRAGKQASSYLGAKANVIRADFGQRTRTIPAQTEVPHSDDQSRTPTSG